MADPHIRAVLTPADQASVVVYRLSLLGAALSVGGVAAGLPLARWVCVGAALVMGLTIHLYDPFFRRLARCMAWPAVLGLALGGAAPEASGVAVAATLAPALALCAFVAGKEYFCFRIPGLRLVPPLLVAGGFGLALGGGLAAAIPLAPASFVLVWLALAKMAQPLHFDIGDPTAYR